MFGVNQLSKTAEGTCNQTGFEQQLLHICRMDLMNYFVREPGTAVRQFINEKQQISNCIKGLFVRPTSPSLHARFLSDFASVQWIRESGRNIPISEATAVYRSAAESVTLLPVQGPTMEFSKSYMNRHNEGNVCFLSRTPPQKKAPSIPSKNTELLDELFFHCYTPKEAMIRTFPSKNYLNRMSHNTGVTQFAQSH